MRARTIKETMQIPFTNKNKNKPIRQRYPLENPNYIGDSNSNKIKKFRNESELIMYARKIYPSIIADDIEAAIDGYYGEEMQDTILLVKNSNELENWLNTNFEL